MSEWTLLLDYGTCASAAAIGTPTRIDPVEISGAVTVPSGVFRDARGGLVVGLAAQRQARLTPERYVRAPLLAAAAPDDRAAAITEVVRVLGREAVRRQRRPPGEVRVTFRGSVTDGSFIRDAVSSAGFPSLPVLVVDPLVATSLGLGLPREVPSLVCDLGGAGFSAAVLTGSTVQASGFVAGAGGEALDALLFREIVARAVRGWDASVARQLLTPPNATWRRAVEDLHRETRRAKEELSSSTTATVDTSAVAGRALPVGRGEVEAVLGPAIRACVNELHEVLERASVAPSDLAAIHLTGAAGRMPLLGGLIAEELGVLPIVTPSPRRTLLLGLSRHSSTRGITHISLPTPPTSPPAPEVRAAPEVRSAPAPGGAAEAAPNRASSPPPTPPRAPAPEVRAAPARAASLPPAPPRAPASNGHQRGTPVPPRTTAPPPAPPRAAAPPPAPPRTTTPPPAPPRSATPPPAAAATGTPLRAPAPGGSGPGGSGPGGKAAGGKAPGGKAAGGSGTGGRDGGGQGWRGAGGWPGRGGEPSLFIPTPPNGAVPEVVAEDQSETENTPGGRLLWVPVIAGATALFVLAGALAVNSLLNDRHDNPSATSEAVSGLTADVTGISVKLTWTPFPGADSYRLYRDPKTEAQTARVVTGTTATDRPGDDGKHTYSVVPLDGSNVAGEPAPLVEAAAKAPYEGAQPIASSFTELIPEQEGKRGAAGQVCRTQGLVSQFSDGEIRCVYANGVRIQVLSYDSPDARDRRAQSLQSEPGAVSKTWSGEGNDGRRYSGKALSADHPTERTRWPWRFWTYEQEPTYAVYATWPRHTGAELTAWWAKGSPFR